MRLKLHYKLILLICSLLMVIIVAFGLYAQYLQAQTMKNQIGIRALAVAESVAQIPELREAFREERPWERIMPLVEGIRAKTGAEYIVIGNRDGIRLAHPNPEKIGHEMVGGDNGPVFAGQSIISEAVGSLGPALRGKVPIRDEQGQVIGVVSVGFMMEQIEQGSERVRRKIALISEAALVIGVLGALLIAHSVKHAIFGLEPKQIARMYQEKQAVLESIREGILAVNQEGVITTANPEAVKLFALMEKECRVGANILDVLPGSQLMQVVRTGVAQYDREMMAGDEVLVLNRVPVLDERGRVIGAVSSFRNKSELFKVTEELSLVKRYAESLRAQTHEYSNKLHLISGLIQLESYQDAIDLIARESDVHQNLVHFLLREVPDPMIGGLLIGKFNRAKELRVELTIDPSSSLIDVPASMDRSLVVTILGNLIDNALEASLAADREEKRVNVFLTDLGDDLIFEVEDNGVGVLEDDAERIFELGYSTKQGPEQRGYGLALVKRAVELLHGYITYEPGRPVGTLFTVAIPKQAREEEI